MANASGVRELIEGVSALLTQHLMLARLELKEDATYFGVRIGVILALAPLMLVGYFFLCVALALALQQALSPPLAFLCVGGGNILLFIIAAAIAGMQLSRRKPLEGTMEELEATRVALLPTVAPAKKETR